MSGAVAIAVSCDSTYEDGIASPQQGNSSASNKLVRSILNNRHDISPPDDMAARAKIMFDHIMNNCSAASAALFMQLFKDKETLFVHMFSTNPFRFYNYICKTLCSMSVRNNVSMMYDTCKGALELYATLHISKAKYRDEFIQRQLGGCALTVTKGVEFDVHAQFCIPVNSAHGKQSNSCDLRSSRGVTRKRKRIAQPSHATSVPPTHFDFNDQSICLIPVNQSVIKEVVLIASMQKTSKKNVLHLQITERPRLVWADGVCVVGDQEIFEITHMSLKGNHRATNTTIDSADYLGAAGPLDKQRSIALLCCPTFNTYTFSVTFRCVRRQTPFL